MKIKLDPKTNKWIELPKYSKEGYYIEPQLFKKILNVIKILKKDWDCVFLIDGIEGSGKSNLALFLGFILSYGMLSIKNLAESSDDAISKLEHLPDKSILIIDEGSLMFSSKEVMNREQKKLIKILNVIRQKNMVLIIIAPSFFDLNKYISVGRSRFLIHVYSKRDLTRGFFSYFGEKKKKFLYIIGKKNYNSYSKPRAKFNGRFTKFEPDWYKEYLQTKVKTLSVAFKDTPQKSEAMLLAEIRKKIEKNLLDFMEKMYKIKLKGKEMTQIFQISPRTYDYDKKSLKIATAKSQ